MTLKWPAIAGNANHAKTCGAAAQKTARTLERRSGIALKAGSLGQDGNRLASVEGKRSRREATRLCLENIRRDCIGCTAIYCRATIGPAHPDGIPADCQSDNASIPGAEVQQRIFDMPVRTDVR